MPRVLSISHSYVVALNRRLVQEMAKIGGQQWQIAAVAPASFHARLRPLTAEPKATDDQFAFETVPLGLGRKAHTFLYGLGLRELLRSGMDIVHAWEEPYVFAGAQIAAWSPSHTPLVFASFQNIAKRYPPPFAQMERYAVRRSAGVVVGGHTVAEALGTKPLYRERPMRIIPLGVDVQRFVPDAIRGAETRRRLGWADPQPPVVGFLGRFEAAKGVLLLCRVLERARVPWRALFVGTGPLESELLKWAAHRADRVRIVTNAHHDDVPEHLNAMDVLCAPSQTTPSWREQVGRMLIEAFASGLPVIGSSSGEIPYTVSDAGVIVEETNEDAWSRAIERLLADAAERRRLAQAGLERAHARYAWPVIAREYLSFFEEVLSTRASASRRARSAAS
jgi:phosphatidyl-myo-inositol dimannoside synthase